jgi:hypothetical protein
MDGLGPALDQTADLFLVRRHRYTLSFVDQLSADRPASVRDGRSYRLIDTLSPVVANRYDEHSDIEDVRMRPKPFLTVPAMLLAALALALATPGIAHGQDDDTAVSIAGTLSGPNGAAKLGVTVRGTADHLSGSGGSGHVTLAPATFTFDGAMDGAVVRLNGHIVHAGFEFLVGTPVTLTADTATGRIELSFGPIRGGPQAGETLSFTGTGRVSVADPRVGALRMGPA